MKMTIKELESFKSLLQTKNAELAAHLGSRDEIVIEKTPDALDELQMANDRELAISNLARNSSIAALIRNALARFEDRSYGVCQRCEEAISPKRMRALPWAAFCIKCQEWIDHYGSSAIEKVESFAPFRD